MGVAVEMLGGKLVKFGILKRFHLMDQSDRHVHAFARLKDKLFDSFGFGRFLDPQFEAPGAQIERLRLDLMKMKGALLALPDLQNLAAIPIRIGDPDFASPSLRFYVYWLPRAAHAKLLPAINLIT